MKINQKFLLVQINMGSKFKWSDQAGVGRKKGRCAGNGNAKDLRKKSEKEN